MAEYTKQADGEVEKICFGFWRDGESKQTLTQQVMPLYRFGIVTGAVLGLRCSPKWNRMERTGLGFI